MKLPIACEQIAIDLQRILQVLLNYLANAIKFTPEGGTITLNTRLASCLDEAQTLPLGDADQSFPTDPTSQFIVLSVRDTGIGIPLNQQHLLFQMFQQIDGGFYRSQEGTGLGLVLSKRLVGLHKGRVSFSSTPEIGSTFSAWLPLV
ncbi:MAG: hypothetical protein DCF22_17715 [Leptolyngbya sp.]|nr:MAG: hypothetical protein DCF22_17715 [Leptolyngbya sp.]